MKSEIRTDKVKSVATDVSTALASGVSSGKMKSLEHKNEDLRDEIAIRDETIEQLQSNIKQMQVEHIKEYLSANGSANNTTNFDNQPDSLYCPKKQRDETLRTMATT